MVEELTTRAGKMMTQWVKDTSQTRLMTWVHSLGLRVIGEN